MEALAKNIGSHQRRSYHLLKLRRQQWEIEEDLTRDGSLDYRGNPARKSLTGGWRACAFIIWFEMMDMLSYFGILSNLIMYLTTELHEGVVVAARNVNIWCGMISVFPILGAFISDAYLGRYHTIAITSGIYILGLTFLTLSVTVEPFKPAKCDNGSSTCPEVTPIQIASLFISLYLISIGRGGLKPCLIALGADQFDDTDPIEKQKKSSFFNWWYFVIITGSLLAFTIVVYIQENVGWGLSFGIITVAMATSLILFLAGTPFYRSNAPSGNSFGSIAQVIVATLWKWNTQVPDDSALLYEKNDKEFFKGGRRKLLHTKDHRFLDKAAVKASKMQSQLILDEELNAFLMVDGENDSFGPSLISPWRLCTVTQVEELKLLLRILPIWIASIMYGAVTVQITTFFTKQGSSMDRKISSNFSIPAASLLTFSTILSLILVPIYDRAFVPIARRITGNERGVTMLQRIGFGLFFTNVLMVTAAFTEMKRLNIIKENGLTDNPNAVIPMSIFWLLPQYLFFAVTDLATMVGLQELFYSQVPDTMRSIGLALHLSAHGFGNFLSSFLITIVDSFSTKYGGKSWFSNNLNQCHLDYFYLFLGLLCALNFCFYLLVARSYTYKIFG